MRKIIMGLLIAGIIFNSASVLCAKNLQISTGNWAPMSGAELPHGGFVNHVVKEAFSRVGYEVKFNYYPWERAYQIMINCMSDASSFWYKGKNRQEKAFYSEPVSEEEFVFFYQEDNPMTDWEELKDLEKYKIGISHGLTYPDKLLKLGESKLLKLEQAKNDLINFKKLARGQIDIFPSTREQGKKLLRENFDQDIIDKIKLHPKPLKVVTGHLLFPKCSPDSEKYLKDFNEGLRKLKKDKTFEKYQQDLYKGKYSN